MNRKNILIIFLLILQGISVCVFYNIDNELVLVMSKVTASRSSKTKNLTKVFNHSYCFNFEKAITFGIECYAVMRVLM